MLRRTMLSIGAGLALMPSSAMALTVSRAELDGDRVRVEGTGAAAGAQVSVSSTSTVARATASSSGTFRVEASGFRSDSCSVTVSDGGRTADAAATLSGCAPSSPPPPPPPPAPTPPPPPPPPPAACTINPEAPVTMNVGTLSTFFITTTGCRTSERPVRWRVVSGRIPPNMTLFTQGVSSGGITGRPTTEGVYAFTLEVSDQTGARDIEAFQITVGAPRPLVVTNQSDALTPGTVGQSYCCANLFADGGVPGYTWSLRSGQLPPGLRLTTSPGSVTGTPTTAGTFSFVVRVTDSRGAFAERTFSITIA